MYLSPGRYKYVIVGFNGDPPSTGFASRVSTIVGEMTSDGSRALLIRFIPLHYRSRSWKKNWPRKTGVDLLEIPALPISRFGAMRRLSVALCSLMLQAIINYLRPQVVQCECHEAAALGVRIKFGGKLYADVHGAAPEESRYSRTASGRPDIDTVRWLDEVELCMIRQCNKLIVVSDHMIGHLEKKWGLPIRQKAELLPIFTDPAFFKPLHKERWKLELGLSEKIVFLYSGGMQSYQCIDETISWFKALKARIPNAALLIFTPDPKLANERVRSIIGEQSYDIRISSICRESLPDHISAADFGFVLREANVLNTVSSPTKAAEYLSRGVWLICTADAGSAIEYVNTLRVGLPVPLYPTADQVDLAVAKVQELAVEDFPIDKVRTVLARAASDIVIERLYRNGKLDQPTKDCD